MKTLVIVRHGDASRDDVALPDAERPLTPLGRRQTAVAVRKFTSFGCSPDRVITSPAKRALDTANIWLKELKLPDACLQIDPEIYEAERSDIQRRVRQLDDANDTVVLVGHNPGVTALLHYLVGRGVEKMTVSSFAVIEIDVDRWSRIALRDSELAHYYTPLANTKHESIRQRFVFWRRQHVQKIELAVVFVIGLIVILGIVALVVRSSTNSSAMPM